MADYPSRCGSERRSDGTGGALFGDGRSASRRTGAWRVTLLARMRRVVEDEGLAEG